MEKVWIEYKGYYILRLSSGSWGVQLDSSQSSWRLQVHDSLEKAMRWIDGQ